MKSPVRIRSRSERAAFVESLKAGVGTRLARNSAAKGASRRRYFLVKFYFTAPVAQYYFAQYYFRTLPAAAGDGAGEEADGMMGALIRTGRGLIMVRAIHGEKKCDS